MGGDILVGDKTYYCNGSILVEWLVAITILLSLIGIGLAIKKVQLWAMLGHRDERMAQGEFILKKHSYSIQEGLMQHHVEIELPEHIESAHTMKRVYFSAYGLPYDGTEFILQDLQTGATNRIWISVQTGRIRWESL